jgi:hypothetical protein
MLIRKICGGQAKTRFTKMVAEVFPESDELGVIKLKEHGSSRLINSLIIKRN